MKEIICEAIEKKRIISFNYKGLERIVEPYAFGTDNKGNYKLRAYQIGGFSESGKIEGWKLFSAENISNLDLLDKTFETIREGYNPLGDKQIPYIICKV